MDRDCTLQISKENLAHPWCVEVISGQSTNSPIAVDGMPTPPKENEPPTTTRSVVGGQAVVVMELGHTFLQFWGSTKCYEYSFANSKQYVQPRKPW